MPRRTLSICACIRYLSHRHPGIMLYHVLLFMFVTIALIAMVTKVPSDDEPNHGEREKREVAVERRLFVADPIMPLDRVLDDELAQWISDLLSENKGENSEDENAIIIDDRAIVDAGLVGQGGLISREVKKNNDRNRPQDLHPVDLPVPKFLRQQMGTRTNRNDAEQPLPAEMVQQDRVHEGRLPDSKVIYIEQSRNWDDDGDSKSISKDISGLHADDEHSTRRLNVLIVAAMRTGSSFLGELFQQRADFFYMFEPGMLLMEKLDSLQLSRRIMVTELIQMLNRFYQCQFGGMPFFVDLLNQKSITARKHVVPAIVNKESCRKLQKTAQHIKYACVPVTTKLLETTCESRAHTAIKSIRILDINLMLDAVTNRQVDLKLIHLVRDPRSMIVSRLKLLFPETAVFNVSHLSSTHRNILTRYCSNWLQNYEIGHYVPSMRKNYLFVRYEDVALDPYKSAEVIYDFVGLGATIPASVQTWIDQNTNTNDRNKKKSAAFSTKRDSKSVPLSWKRKITVGFARAVEQIGDCPRLMQVSGYKLIGDESAKLDNDDYLLGPLPDPLLNVNAFDFL